MLGSPEIDWAGDEVEDVNNNYDFETEDEVKDDFFLSPISRCCV